MRRNSWLVSAYDGLVTACAAIVGVLILLTVVLVTSDVVGRYFFGSPIGWVFELTEHILVCVPFLGMAWLARRAEHVKIEIVVQLLSERWKARAEFLANFLSGAACGIATYYAFATTLDHFSRGIVTYGIYPVPKYLLIGIVTFGLALTTIEFFRKAFIGHRAESGDA